MGAGGGPPRRTRSRRHSIAVQRSITTDSPPACAIRAASQLTTPSCSHRHFAPAATASRRAARTARTGGRRRPCRTARSPRPPRRCVAIGRDPQDRPLVRVDRHAIEALVQQVAEHAERGPRRDPTRRRRPRSGGSPAARPRWRHRRAPDGPRPSCRSRKAAARSRSAAGRSAGSWRRPSPVDAAAAAPGSSAVSRGPPCRTGCRPPPAGWPGRRRPRGR